jgi:hypothetical protein
MKRSETARAVLATAIVTAVFVVIWPVRQYLLRASQPALSPEPSPEEMRPHIEAAQQRQRVLTEGRQVAETFLAAIQSGRLEQTYDSFGIFFSDEERIGREELVALLREQPTLRNVGPLRQTGIVDSPPFYVYYWGAETEGGKAVDVEVWVATDEDASLRVVNFVVDNVHVTASRPRDVPKTSQ